MKILLIGDVHGRFQRFGNHILNTINRGIEFDAIIQCGDFGIYTGAKEELRKLMFKIKLNKLIYFIDGNHEDHYTLYLVKNKLDKMGVIYQQRGTILKLKDGTKVGFMGGAFNVDRPQQNYLNGTYNFPHKSQIENFSNLLKKEGGVDLMITHSCPSNIGIGIKGHQEFFESGQVFIGKLGFPVSPVHDIGDSFLTDLWNQIEGFRPKHWVFAHVHKHHLSKVDNTEFCSVGCCDGTDELPQPKIYIYDTETKEILI